MVQYYLYRKRLDVILQRISDRYMGHEVRFAELVPQAGHISEDKLACCVAQMLTVQMSRAEQLSDRELSESFWWLQAAALFVLHTTPEEDHVLGSLIKLSKLSKEALQLMNLDQLPAKQAMALPYVPKHVSELLEEAVWLLAEFKSEKLNALERCLEVC